jgi:hypothetical protein
VDSRIILGGDELLAEDPRPIITKRRNRALIFFRRVKSQNPGFGDITE